MIEAIANPRGNPISKPLWHAIGDEALVEKLLPAIQRTIAEVCAAEYRTGPDDQIPVAVADLSNVFLMLLATVLEPLPECASPQGARLMSEAAGKELFRLIRDTKRLKLADQVAPGSLQ